MRHKICLVVLVCFIAMALAACSQKEESFQCDFCGREQTGVKHELTLAEEPVAACDSCYGCLLYTSPSPRD